MLPTYKFETYQMSNLIRMYLSENFYSESPRIRDIGKCIFFRSYENFDKKNANKMKVYKLWCFVGAMRIYGIYYIRYHHQYQFFKLFEIFQMCQPCRYFK